jgi:MFS family permease
VTSAPPRAVIAARNGVAVVFALNGFVFASWMSRLPAVRDELGLSPAQLGLLLLAISLGSLSGLPLAGVLCDRFGSRRVVACAAVLVAVAQTAAAAGAESGVPLAAAVPMAFMGFGIGVWDVAMNLHGAHVEQHLGRTVMPRFHAGFSLGTVLGAGVGAAAAALDLDLLVHLALTCAVGLVGALVAVRSFLPPAVEGAGDDEPAPVRTSAWLEPRTLMIGLMVLALAFTEGTANDWLAVALVDGYDVPDWAGALGFGAFVTAMTLGRLLGPPLLDRHGRVTVLWSTMGVAFVGVLLTVLAPVPAVAVVGILLWGLGASLGFPVGMSAAADDPRRAAARVSVVSTIGYTAFLAGPPLVGFVGEHSGTLQALLVVAVLLVPSALVVPAAREPRGA